jgi:hypothetical protein
VASLANSEQRRRSGKVARHIVVGTAWGRVENGVEGRPNTWPVPAQRAFGWVTGSMTMKDGDDLLCLAGGRRA